MIETVTTSKKENSKDSRPISSGKISLTSEDKKAIEDKFSLLYTLITAVVLVLIFMLGTLILDSLRFSSVAYREYSEKTEVMDNLKKLNQSLVEQNNQKDKTIVNLIEIKRTK